MRKARIFYARTDEFWRRGEKYKYLEENEHRGNIAWRELQPDAKHNWLTEGMQDEFEGFVPIGDKKTKGKAGTETIFNTFGGGVKTNRDDWSYNFDSVALETNIKRSIGFYNEQVIRWLHSSNKNQNVDEFVAYDDKEIGWSRDLKLDLQRGKLAEFSEEKVRRSQYRPYTRAFLFFDRVFNEEVYIAPYAFPTLSAEQENRVIVVTINAQIPFSAQMLDCIPCVDVGGRPSQCFPFYTYDEDGSNRRENITDWALEKFRGEYGDASISKWEVFHYVYAVLHHGGYRERYAANLKRELPRIPFAASLQEFKWFAEAGARLSEIHVNYEQQPEYPLERIENPEAALDWRVEKMRLSRDKRSILYNDFLTLGGVPAQAFEYRLGNRSALEWVIDQYQVSTDKRSGITNDPNRADDPQYIVRLIGQVVTVSLETVKIVQDLPALGPTAGA